MIPISRDSYSLIADSIIGLDACEISRKVADIMFIYNLINYNIDCPEFLFEVRFHTPVHLTRLTLLYLYLNIKLI